MLEGRVSWGPVGWLLGKVTEYDRVFPFRNCPWVSGTARQPCWGGQYRLALVHPPPPPVEGLNQCVLKHSLFPSLFSVVLGPRGDGGTGNGP